MEFTPELIPHEYFHTGSWWLSVERPEWYYFSDHQNAPTKESKELIRSVDKPLRKLVKWLHQHGIPTTPSCSGHHIRERVLENIYAALEMDAEVIRTGGLFLKNIETDARFAYHVPNYVLPWSKEAFIEQVSAYQQKGVLGLRMDKYPAAISMLCSLQIPETTIEEKDSIVFIFTSGENTRGDNKAVWRTIRREVKKVLEPYLVEGETPS